MTVHRRRLAFRDHALERRVLQWMILGAARHPPVLRVSRRPLGYRPGYEHAVDLEAEVIMVAAARRGAGSTKARPVLGPVGCSALSVPPTWLGAVSASRPDRRLRRYSLKGMSKALPVGRIPKTSGLRRAPGQLACRCRPASGQVIAVAGQALDGVHGAPHRPLGDLRSQQAVADGIQQLVDIGQSAPSPVRTSMSR